MRNDAGLAVEGWILDAHQYAWDAFVCASGVADRPNRMGISPALYTFLGGRLPGSGKHGRKLTSRERRANRRRRMQRNRTAATRYFRENARAIIDGWPTDEEVSGSIAAWFLTGQAVRT